MQILQVPVCVLVVGMAGCPACEAYLPKFREMSKKYGHCVQSVAIDANDYPQFADYLHVTATPTTFVLRYGRPSGRAFAGDLDPKEIERIFASAAIGGECVL